MNRPHETILPGRNVPAPGCDDRVRVRGKFLFAGDRKFWVKGVTYGTFRPSEGGHQFPAPDTVTADFAAMANHGFNTVRTYTVPPRWLLDIAQGCGIRVLVGLPWEQHVAFLDDRKLISQIESAVRDGVQACAGHPAVLGYTVGNEIPSSIVRWHGRRRIERFIKRLYGIAKSQDREALVTYVNYPTTEYLQLPFLDLVCFNVYLESRDRLEAYLARLQNLAEERPLLMAEIGLDSRRHGVERQAESLDWQVRTAFAAGCAGAFAFAWTDEWYRGGYDIEDWDFGLTTRDRAPKPALRAVQKAMADVPFAADRPWPRVTVVVCSYNGSRTIRDTLEGLKHLDYPNFEVIVVNDGSTDATPEIAADYPFRLISTENRGLSNARNTGWQHATGEIVAYIDDDAYPDPHWLQYLADTFMTTDFVGVGGPNLAPPGDGPIAECVYNAPGGPVHVLLTDRIAEHIPGCNMAFRRDALKAIDGFDPRYRVAGDDVDLCWRLQNRGGMIGFHAAAMDWHHRRNSLRMYWRQQQGYGKAEALLEEKWPERYNPMGHLTWGGRLYGRGWTLPAVPARWRIYQGVWGAAPFQPLYQSGPNTWFTLPLMPEWYLVIGALALLSLLGLSWPPLLTTVPFLAVALLVPIAQAVPAGARARFPTEWPSAGQRLRLRAITAFLHLMQPLARLIGRIRHGLTLWRIRGEPAGFRLLPGTLSLWQEDWEDPATSLQRFAEILRQSGVVVRSGGDYDEWDFYVRGGLFGGARVLMATEEHGAGKQLKRFSVIPSFAGPGVLLASFLAYIAFASGSDGAWFACIVTGLLALSTIGLLLVDSGRAVAIARKAVPSLGNGG